MINITEDNLRAVIQMSLCGNFIYTEEIEEKIIHDVKLLAKDTKIPSGIKDKNGKDIHFGDTLRFVDKVEWYRGKYWAKVATGLMTKEQSLEEIKNLPYEERLVENVNDYEWLLSSEIQTYWEIVNDDE